MNRRLFTILALASPTLATSARAWNPFSSYWENTAMAAKQNDAAAVRQLAADDPNQLDDDGRTGMHYAALNGNLQIMAILIKAGAHVSPRDRLGNTPLHLAAERNRTEAAELLIEAGAKLDIQNKDGMTPLMIAASRGNLELVRALIDSGANPHTTDFTGRDAAGWALESHHPAVAEAIRRAGHSKHS
jgi:uncharacterized protein